MKRCPQCNRVESDDALAFCREDGTALISDSGAVSGEAGTAKFVSAAVPSEIETSVLQHRTDAAISRPTAPTTVLPANTPTSTTHELPKPKRLAVVMSLAALALVAVVVSGYFYFSRKTNTSIQSIAVMPFINESGNAELEYLTDGMTESLINSLSQLPNLSVKARSTVFHFKGKGTTPQQVGSELSVQAVLNGSVKQHGDQLTLSLELVDAPTGDQIWGEQYNRQTTDLVALQSEIARDVSGKLRSKLSGAEVAKVAKNYTANADAYQLYLKGRFYWNKRTVDGLKLAALYYNQAIEKDPNFALAYAGLAETYSLYANYSVARPKDSSPQAKAAALKALEIDDKLAEAHAALGLYYAGYAWNFSASEKELRRAIELKPNYATAHHWLGNAPLLSEKKFDEAIAEGRRAQELDPLSAIISADLAYNLLFAGRYGEAIDQCQKALTIDPNFYYTHYLLGWVYQLKGMHKAAITSLRKSIELNPDPFAKALLITSLVKAGERAEALKLRDELKSEATKRYVPGYFLALAAAAFGERDEAFALLDKDVSDRSSYVSTVDIDPNLDELKNDPRFAALLQKIEAAKLN